MDNKYQSFFKIKKQPAFFGRENELKKLSNFKQNYMGWHIGVHGSRRVGKTSLVNFFIQKRQQELAGNRYVFVFKLTGNKFETKQEAIHNAIGRLNFALEDVYGEWSISETRKFTPIKTNEIHNWNSFFETLIFSLKKLYETAPTVAMFIFFDELDWFPNNEGFVNGYSNLINQTLFPMENVMTFIASSSNSWIKSRIFKDVAGLHRRLTVFELKPFSFREILTLFQHKGWQLTERQVFDYYLMFGGYIKHYLELLGTTSPPPLKDNFKNLIEDGDYFQKEVEDVFRNLFDNKGKYRQVCEAICELKHAGAIEVAKHLGKNSKATSYSTTLTELANAGVLSYTKSGNKFYYYCATPLVYFFFYFKGEYREVLYENWRGSAFELATLAHLKVIGDYFNKQYHDPKLNFVLRDSDLSPHGSQNIKAQIDLLTKTNSTRKSVKFQVFELKAKTLTSLKEKEIEDFVKRLSFLEQYLNKKQKAVLEPVILAMEENSQRHIFSLPNILR